MSTVKYKDYQGAVTFQDGRLFIQILHIDDLISTECDSASKVQEAFEDLVDDYIDSCKELGQEPNKPFKGSFNVRIDPALHREAALAAADHDESLNSWIERAIEVRLEHERLSSRPDIAIQFSALETASTASYRPVRLRRSGAKLVRAQSVFSALDVRGEKTFVRTKIN